MVRRKLVRTRAHWALSLVKVENAPVPVETIARIAGVKVQKVPTDDELSGFLYRDIKHDTSIIGINANHSRNRQNFTLAHELGHFFLHKFEDVHVDRSFRIKLRSQVSSDGTDVEEIEANLFAAELLMPNYMLESDIEEFDGVDDDESIADLANKYGVSTQAMMFRLAYLGYISI